MGLPAVYELTGPTAGDKGSPSTLFTLAPSTPVTDTVTLASSPSGTFTPASLSFSSSAAKTFRFTPHALGTYTITLTSALGDTVIGSPFTYKASPNLAKRWFPGLRGNRSTARGY